MFKLKGIIGIIMIMMILVCGFTLSFADKYVAKQITHNTVTDYAPVLYNGEIAWRGYEDGDYEIYY